MKIAVIIPDRNDRPKLLDNCIRQLKAQTVTPDLARIVNYKPVSDAKDITPRYRKGYDDLRGKNLDAILFIENDDWYAPNYIETMLDEWNKAGRPDIFGTNYTIYYHIKERAWFKTDHIERSCAMSTLIKPDLDLTWPLDHDPYTDIWLWHYAKSKEVFEPKKHICLGIKHGSGLCGGQNHFDEMHRYVNADKEYAFFRSVVDGESFKFYTNYENP